jgi:hypothetical protein
VEITTLSRETSLAHPRTCMGNNHDAVDIQVPQQRGSGHAEPETELHQAMI